MMFKNGFKYHGIYVLVAIPILFIVGCSYQKQTADTELSINYYYTTEGSYYNSKIEGLKIIYTHTDYEKIKERCAQWVQQSPCWTQQDLITEEAQLTTSEITSLKNLIEETKIMQLENYYGPEEGARCYAHILKIDEKEINYCSGFDGPSEPEAFGKVAGKIQEIVAQKFSK